MQHIVGFRELQKGTISLKTTTFKVMIADASYVPAPEDIYLDAGGSDDPIDHELSITGYARQTITVDTGFTITDEVVASIDRIKTIIEDITFSALQSGTDLTGSHFVVYAEVSDDTDSIILCTFPIGAYTTNGGDITMSGAGFYQELNNA